MFYYTMSKTTNMFTFQKTEKILDEHLHGFVKGELLVDVDGSAFLMYHKMDDKVKLSNDFDIDAVLIDSTMKLDFLNGLAIIAYEE